MKSPAFTLQRAWARQATIGFLGATTPAAWATFLAAFDEAQGTYLIGAPNIVTMPNEMYSLIGHYPGQVSAVFSILLSIPSVLLMLGVRKHVMSGALAEGFQLR